MDKRDFIHCRLSNKLRQTIQNETTHYLFIKKLKSWNIINNLK